MGRHALIRTTHPAFAAFAKGVTVATPERDGMGSKLELGVLSHIVATAFCFLFAAHALAETSQDRRVVVLHSEDDALCKPLADLYQWIIFGQSKVGFYAEDAFAARFRAIGLHTPKSLDDDLHPSSPGPFKQAYYRFKFAGEAQPHLVYLEDRPVGHHGDFKTNIWILKPGADVDGQKRFIDGYNFKPESIDLAILLNIDSDFVSYWGTDQPNFRMNIGPFFFRKIASQADLALPQPQRALMVPNIGTAISYSVQRIFLFHDEPIFVADDQLAFLAYRFRDSAIDEVCELARADYLGTLKRDYLTAVDRIAK